MKKTYSDQILKQLANLQVAIALLFIIGIAIGIGTIIEQDQSLSFYQNSYPEAKPIFGFITCVTVTTFPSGVEQLLSSNRLKITKEFLSIIIYPFLHHSRLPNTESSQVVFL